MSATTIGIQLITPTTGTPVTQSQQQPDENFVQETADAISTAIAMAAAVQAAAQAPPPSATPNIVDKIV
jgi:hypothetical protein